MEKFKSIPELIQSLNLLAQRINKGTVGLEEFEVTLRDARELYERLVILRYKAIEDRNLMGMARRPPDEANAASPTELKEPVPEPALAPKQISLIDSIEEIAREDEPETRSEVTPPAAEKTSQPVQQTIALDEPQNEKPEPDPTPKSEPKPAAQSVPEAGKTEPQDKRTMSTLNEAISNSSQGNTLADQLGRTKIDDLAVAIGLNQKFQFIKELFDGDADAYSKAVTALNQCDSHKEAQNVLKNEWMKPYGWDEEDETTLVFLNLVERRYL